MRILLSLLTIGVVSVVAFRATSAFFNDTETSTGNTITADTLDLQISNKAWLNGNTVNELVFTAKDLTSSDKIFNFSNIVPGDKGANSIDITPAEGSTPVWACVAIGNVQNDENLALQAEIDDGDSPSDINGELAQHLKVFAWSDDNHDGIWNGSELPLFTSPFYGPASDVLAGRVYPIADSTTGGVAINGGSSRYLGINWCLGAMVVTPATKTVTCDGSSETNVTQTDSLKASVRFYAEQAQNNASFRCSDQQELLTFTPPVAP